MPYTLLILSLVLGYTWVAVPLLGNPRWMGTAVTFSVLAAGFTRAIRTREWGLDMHAFRPSLIRVVPLTLPVLLLIALIGWRLGTFEPRGNLLYQYSFLYLWALGQQFALQTVLFREAEQRLGDRSAVWVAGGLFAFLHLPNPLLTPLTFGAGVVWCRIFSVYPNLLPLALSHSLGSLALLHSLNREVTGGMRVGYSYLLLE